MWLSCEVWEPQVSQSERELLDAAVDGSADALAALLNEHGPEVRRRLAINPVWQAVLDPADVMQVTYLEAFLRIHQLEARTADGFRAWLDRLAQNNLRDAIREMQRQKRPDPRNQMQHVGGDSATTLLDALGSGSQTASHTAAARESQQVLEAALAHLPPLYAQVVRAHDLEGRSVAEVATALGRTPGAVYMLRARALDRLRELLGPESRFFSRGK